MNNNLMVQQLLQFTAGFDEASKKNVYNQVRDLVDGVARYTEKEFTQKFADIFKNAFASASKPVPIDIGQVFDVEGLAKQLAIGFISALELTKSSIGDAVNDVVSEIQKELTELEETKQNLLKQQEEVKKHILRERTVYGPTGEQDHVDDDSARDKRKKDFNTSDFRFKDIASGEKELNAYFMTYIEDIDNVTAAYQSLRKASDETSKQAAKKAYLQSIDQAIDKLTNLYQIQQRFEDLKLTSSKVYQKIFKGNDENDIASELDEINETAITSEDEFLDIASKRLSARRSSIEERLKKSLGSSFDGAMEVIDQKLLEIDKKIQEIRANNGDTIDQKEAEQALKTVEEIEAAYDRLLNKKGKTVNKGKKESILASLDYQAKGDAKTLASINRGYEDATDWEDQYQWLLKYVAEYQALEKKGNLTDQTKSKYGERFQKFVLIAENARASLEQVLAKAGVQFDHQPTPEQQPQQIDDTNTKPAEQNKLVQEYNANKQKTLDLLAKEKLSYEEILYLIQENQKEYARTFFGEKNYDLGDDAFALFRDVAAKIVPPDASSGMPFDKAFNGVGMTAEAGAQILWDYYNKQHTVATATANSIEDEDEALQKENGTLEDKLELLRDIADEYGNQITQKNRDRYEELNQKDMNSGLSPKEEDRYSELGEQIDADEALDEFEKTYDRIILKLGNGKKVEILPTDKGLRDLYAFANEGYGEDYKGVEIEDIIFERAKQESVAIEDTTDKVYDKIKSYEELEAVVKRYNELLLKQITAGQKLTKLEKTELSDILGRFHATKGERTPDQAINDLFAFNNIHDRLLGTTSTDGMAKYLNIANPRAEEEARATAERLENERLIREEQEKQLKLAEEARVKAEEEARLANEQAEAERQIAEEKARQVEEESLARREAERNSEMARQVAESAIEEQIRAEDRAVEAEKEAAAKRDFIPPSQQSDGTSTTEVSDVQMLKTAVDDVTAAVNKKTEAFKTEQAAVGSIVDAENTKLSTLEETIGRISGLLNNLKAGKENLAEGLSNINVTVTHKQDLTENNNPFQQVLQQVMTLQQEYAGLFNSKTGKMSEELAVGDSSRRVSADFNNYDGYDTMWHTHPEAQTAVPGGTDWDTWLNQFESIKKQIVISQNEIASFDFSSLTKEAMGQIIEALNMYIAAAKTDEGWKSKYIQYEQQYGHIEGSQVWLKDITQTVLSQLAPNVMKTFPRADMPQIIDQNATEYKADGTENIVLQIKSVCETITQTCTALTSSDNKPSEAINTESINQLVDAIRGSQGDTQKGATTIIDDASFAKLSETFSKVNISGTFNSDGLALEDTLQKVLTSVTAINEKIIKGTVANIRDNSSGTSAPSRDRKTKQKDGTISHGKASGKSGSIQKLYDYYLWLEEQIEQFKDNSKYVGELSKIRDQITPKILAYEETLQEKNEKDPTWMAPLLEKHNLHMAKIQGGQEYSDSVSTEKKALEILNEEYKLKQSIFALEQKGATVDELTPLQEQLGIYKSIRETLESNMDNGELTRYAVQASKVQTKGERALSVDEIKTNIKARKDETIAAEKAEKEAIDSVITATKEYNDAKIKAAKATEPEVKTHWESIANDALARRLQLQKNIEESTGKTIDLTKYETELQQNLNAVKAQQDANIRKNREKNEKKDFASQVKKVQDESRVNKAKSVWTAASGTFIDALGVPNISPDQMVMLKDYKTKLDALRNTYDLVNAEINENGSVSAQSKENIITQTSEVSKLQQTIKGLVNQYDKLSGDNVQEMGVFNLAQSSSLTDYRNQLWQTIMTASDGKAVFKDFDNTSKELHYTVKTGKNEWTNYTAQVRTLDNQIVSTSGTVKKVEGLFDAIKRKTKEIFTYFSGSSLIFKAFNELKKGIQYVRDIDIALTELKKVTNETEETYDSFLNTASKTAKMVGSTIKDVVSSTADWARLGYNIKQAAQLAESTQILMNVSEFTDVSRATDTLISAVQAFEYTAETSMHVVDVLNTIGNNYSISTADLADSLTKSASSLVAANGTLEEAVALTAAANRTVQDAAVVGTALKTTSLRLRGTSVEDYDDESDAEGVITSKSKLQGKVKALSGVNILTDSGAYKSTYEILKEISEVWVDINDMDQAALLELISGKRNASVVASILQSPEDLKAAYEDAQNAEGSALEENEKYMNSIQGLIDQFNNSIQTLWKNTLDDQWIKDIVNLAKWLVNIVDSLGGVQTVLAGIFVYFNMKNFGGNAFGQMFDKIKETKSGKSWKEAFGFGKQQYTSIEDINEQLRLYKVDMDAAGEAYRQNDNIINKQKFEKAKIKYDSYETQVAPTLNAYEAEKTKLNDLQATRATLQQQQEAAQAKLNNASKKNFNTRQQNLNTINQQLEENQSEIDTTTSKIKTMGDTSENTGNKASSAFTTIGTALTNIAQQATYMILMISVMTLIGKIGEAFKNTSETAQEKFKRLNNELSSTESELRSLESQSEDLNKQIDELIQSGPLTFTQQEDLNRMKAQSAELERQIGLTQTLKEALQASTADAAQVASMDYLANTSFGAIDTKSERTEEYGQIGGAIGGVAGGVGGLVAGGAISSALTTWLATTAASSAAGPIGTAVGAIAGALIAGIGLMVGVYGGQATAEAEYNAEQSVGDAIDKMKIQRDKLIKSKNEAQKAYGKDPITKNKEAYEEATKALSDYDSLMAKHIAQQAQYYNSVKDWDKLNKENPNAAEYWRGVGDDLSKYAIEMKTSGAKETAISRIFGEEATDELKKVKEGIEKAVKAGAEVDIKAIFDNEEVYDAFVSRMSSMGIYLTDIKNYYTEIKEAEDEAYGISTFDTVKEISNVTKGVNALKDAFDELREKGIMTSDTIIGLQEIFKDTEGWDEFVNAVSTGTSTMDEIIEKSKDLATNYVSKLLDPNADPEDAYNKDRKATYIAQLEALGVTNANEYLNSLLTKKAIEIGIGNSKGNISVAEVIANSQDLYGDVLKDGLQNEKLNTAILKAIAAEKAKQAEKEIQGNKTLYDAAVIAQGYLEDIKEKDYSDVISTKTITQDKYETSTSDPYAGWSQHGGVWYNQNTGQVSQSSPYQTGGWQTRGGTWYRKVGVETVVAEYEYNGKTYNSLEEAQKAAYQDEIDKIKKEFSDQGVEFNDDNTVKIPTQLDIDAGKASEDTKRLAEEAQAALKEAGFVELNVEFFNKSQLIDDIQSIFDTLTDAQKEFAENGYISVDTFQGLITFTEQYGPKYLAMLYDENGKLNLNKQALYDIAQARMYDMTQQQIDSVLSKAILLIQNDKIKKLKEMAIVTRINTEELKNFNLAQLDMFNILLNASDISDAEKTAIGSGISSQIDAIISSYNLAANNMANAMSSSGNAAKSEADDAFQKAMTYWENQIEAKQHQYDQVQNEIDLLESQGKQAGADYYITQNQLETERLNLLEQQKLEAQSFLKSFPEGSEEWFHKEARLFGNK